MYIILPEAKLKGKQVCLINPLSVPYPKYKYGLRENQEMKTLKSIVHEVEDLLKRYVILLTGTLQQKKNSFYFLVINDEVSIGVLHALGYTLLESKKFSPYGLYWIELKTKRDEI